MIPVSSAQHHTPKNTPVGCTCVSIQSGAAYELLTALTAQKQNTDAALDCCPTVPHRQPYKGAEL